MLDLRFSHYIVTVESIIFWALMLMLCTAFIFNPEDGGNILL
jgi:hypothetical protein